MSHFAHKLECPLCNGQEMDLLTMGKEELSRLEVMEGLQARQMGKRWAAEVLGVSVRKVKRLLSAYRREGESQAGIAAVQEGEPPSIGAVPKTCDAHPP